MRQRLVDKTFVSYLKIFDIGLLRAFCYSMYYVLAIRLPMPEVCQERISRMEIILRKKITLRVWERCKNRRKRALRYRPQNQNRQQLSNLVYGCRIIGGVVTLGNEVMMAPDVLIIAENQETSDLSKLMIL